MKTTLACGFAFAALLATSVSSAATIEYRAVLSGAQEVPPVSTAISVGGSATLTFDDSSKKLYGFVAFQGITATDYHIHKGGACGANGTGILATLPAPNGSNVITIPAAGAGSITLDTAAEAELVAETLYVNIHTSAQPNGHIRGQIYKVVDGGIPTCGSSADGGTDSGTDSGTTSSSGGSSSGGSSSGGSSSGGSSSGGSSGAASNTSTSSGSAAAPAEDDGCSTTGSSSSSENGILIALGLAATFGGMARIRKNLRNKK